MADRTFAQLVTEALHDDFDTTKYSTKAGEAINDAIQEVARVVPLPTQRGYTDLSVVAGTASYTLPTDFSWLRSVVDTVSGYSLTEIENPEDYDTSNVPLTNLARGIPERYMVFGSSIFLSPLPIDARTLRARYQKVPDDISGATAISTIMPDDFAYILVAYARARLFRFEDDPEMADYWQAQFDRGVARMRGQLSSRTRAVRRVGDRRTGRLWPVFRRT